jgi:hypothetical protein
MEVLLEKNNAALMQHVQDLQALKSLILNDLNSESINIFIQQ